MVNSSPKFDTDRRIAALAARQHGVVSRRQLRALGVDDSAVAYRVRVGRLHRLHVGVYAVGHVAVGRRGRWLAAVLACGDGAVLSHAAAGALWGLRPSAAARIDVTVATAAGRNDPTLRPHRSALPAGETTALHGIPVTTPARTILDLAATLQRRPLERLLDTAENTRLTDVAILDALARAHPRHRGAKRLREALHTHTPGSTLTRSELEERFLALCDAAGIDRPLVNHHVAGRERDFVFPSRRLVIETDSWRHHQSRQAFEDDRHRDATLLRAGYRTLRVTHRWLTTEPGEVVATLRAVLGTGEIAA
jgi:hypothetical protein